MLILNLQANYISGDVRNAHIFVPFLSRSIVTFVTMVEQDMTFLVAAFVAAENANISYTGTFYSRLKGYMQVILLLSASSQSGRTDPQAAYIPMS